MRVWDVPARVLCDQHLLGEHSEAHAIWSIHAEGKTGYRDHPEVKRWEGQMPYLASRHDELVAEMQRRGMDHASPLDGRERFEAAGHVDEHPGYVTPVEEQVEALEAKDCPCPLEETGP